MDKLRVILMQGAPGSGKSFQANKLALQLNAEIVSADHYFTKDGVYTFKPAELGAAHKQSQENARKTLESGRSILVDNTNLRQWEAQPYIELARQFGAEIEVVVCNGLYPNTHGVPKNKVLEMRARRETLIF